MPIFAIPVIDAVGAYGAAAVAVLQIVEILIDKLSGIEMADNDKRQQFVQDQIDQFTQQYPNYNIVICHPPCDVDDGAGFGVDPQYRALIYHQHFELGMTVGTCGYDLYMAEQGKSFHFHNNGDGGWINWGFSGNWIRGGDGSDPNEIDAPFSTSPSRIGSQLYSWGNDNIVTANGVAGRLLTQGSALYSVNNPGNSLYKYASGQSGPYYQAIVQTDGNFVVYHFDVNNERTPTFWTNTGGKVNDPNWTLAVQNDGNVVLYHTNSSGNVNSGAYLASNTWQINKPAPGWFGLSMQQDGNLVLYFFYNDGSCDPVWATANNAPTGTIVWPH